MIASSTTPLAKAAIKPERDAEDEADADRDDADQNRHPRAGQQLRGDVAPEQIGAEPMRRATAPSSLCGMSIAAGG